MSAPTTSQYAAIEALREGDGDIAAMKRDYDYRRKYLLDGLRQIGISCFEPRGAFYMFPSLQKFGLSSNDFCEKFLLEEHVAIIPGAAFGGGGEGFARMCYASSVDNISESLTRLKRFIERL
jgi:aminotransferase